MLNLFQVSAYFVLLFVSLLLYIQKDMPDTLCYISLCAKQQRLYQRLYADEIGAQNNNKEVYDSK